MALLLAGCSGGDGSASVHASAPATAVSPATVAADVAPVNADGRLVARYKITYGGSAKGCEAGSDVAPQAYRCFVGNYIYDPCWLDNANAAQTSVLCLPDPWDTRALRLTVAGGGLPAFSGPPPQINRRYPWGVRLADGEDCVAVQGSHDSDHGKVVDYYCGRSYRHVLLRPIDQSSSRWTAQSAYFDGTGYQPGPLERVTTAWYAMVDNGAANDARANDCTATALAYAAQAYEAAHNDPHGALPAINAQACEGGYSEIIFTVTAASDYTVAMAFKASSSGWREIGSGGDITPGSFGMPMSVGQAINNSITSGAQTENVSF